jgi:glycosyltransferase involved in cell wall biosynthesis
MRFLLLNQTFYPDVASTAQHLRDVAVRLVERGHEVTVVTSRRAYDQPERQFPKCETWRGIRIYRVGSTGFGKAARWRRAVDFGTFLLAVLLRLALLPRHDVVVALTSPPLISFLGAWLARVRRSRFVYWVMDFNPDEAIAAGWLRAGSPAASILDWMSRFSLREASRVVALDRFMRERIVAKGIAPEKVSVIPPWSHDGEVKYDPAGRDRFRREHQLEGEFVVMYSGNHSPCHPLDTLLEAARRLAGDSGVTFCFVGGGSEWRKIKANAEKLKADMLKSEKKEGGSGEHPTSNALRAASVQTLKSRIQYPVSSIQQPASGGQHFSVSAFQHASFSNVVCLPYQPLDQLAGSLSAADLHVVVMGDPFVGLVHPCKIYNILCVGAPVLYIGPRPSHVSELLRSLDHGYPVAAVAHGDVDGVVQHIEQIRQQTRRDAVHRPCLQAAGARFSQNVLLPRLIHELETS